MSVTATQIAIVKLYNIISRVMDSFKALSQNCEKRLLASSYLCVDMCEWNISAPTGRIFMKFDI